MFLRYRRLSVHGCVVSQLYVCPPSQGAKVKALAEFLEAPKRLSARDQAALVRNALQLPLLPAPSARVLFSEMG